MPNITTNHAITYTNKLRKRSIFVIDSYLKDSAFIALKRDAKF